MLFGIATYRAGVFPRGAAVLTVLGGIAGILALSAPFQIPLAVAVGWMGWSLVRRSVPEVAPPATARPLGAPGPGTEATISG